MKTATTKANRNRNRLNRSLPALIAMGGSLAALPVQALQLGDLTVQSKLGQPLRASIAFALSPNEQISSSCISLRQGPTASGLPNIGNATLSVANGSIQLTGRTPVREPMSAAYVVVNCPYTANISREYMLFIDPVTPITPVTPVYEAATVTQQTNRQSTPITVAPVTATPVTATPAARTADATRPLRQAADTATSPIGGTEYRVQPGDNLSAIVSRIDNRSMALWPAVNAIFDANPDAFINNDPNKLKAGSLLRIPSLDGTPPVVTPTATASVEAVAETSVLANANADLQPAESEFVNPFVAGGESVVIPDTTLDAPVSSSTSPNVASAAIANNLNSVTTSAGEPSSNWLYWLAGGGVGLILALLLFTRRFRGSVDKTPLSAVVATPQRRASDAGNDIDAEQVEAVAIDFDLSDDSPTTENLALDADLVIGTGLGDGTEIEVQETFAFAGSKELDVELPFEPVANADDDTDMMEALRTDVNSILDSEVLAEDDDYDMSVIVDATQMPRPEDATKYDLKAVEVETADVLESTDSYTINNAVDYQILEQDYEDELTATQALNEEITKAALELAGRMDGDGDETEALPLATVTELDVTAQMPAKKDEVSDLTQTAANDVVTEKIQRDEETIEMPVESGKAG